MYTDHQFTPGFFTLNGTSDVARLDARQRADVGIVRGADGHYERDGVPVDVPAPQPRFLAFLSLAFEHMPAFRLRHA